MPRLTREERHRALGMLEGGLSQSQVARRLGCNQCTIARLIQRNHATGSVDDRQRPGRERVTTERQDRQIQNLHLRDRFRTASRTARETPGRNNPRISSPTVRRRLRHFGLNARRPMIGPELTPVRRQARSLWCRQHDRWTIRDWNGVLFSDESRICVDRADGRERVWRRRNERYANCCIRQRNRWGGPSVMVWAGVSANYRTPLVVIQGNLTAQRYIDTVLRPHVIPFLRDHRRVTTFQHDNARPHAARLTTAYLQNENVNVLPWPAYSPDLNPIEHLWDDLKRRLSMRIPRPENQRQLITALHEEWDTLPQNRFRRLVSGMRRRCTACLAAGGGHTRY